MTMPRDAGGPLTVVVAVAQMEPQPWASALAEALLEQGVASRVLCWPSAEAPAEAVGEARYGVAWLPPAGFLAAAPRLRALFNLGAGVEGLLAAPQLPPQLPVIRLVDVGMAARMAEYVVHFLARITRGLDRYVAGGGPGAPWGGASWRGGGPVVGVLGLGAIGAVVARTVAALGYPVLGWSRSPHAIEGVETLAGDDALDALLARAQVLVDVLPLTPATEGLLDRHRLRRLPAGATLINIGRGGTVVDADLIAALDDGHLAGAVLDVFREEPLPAAHPFWRHPRVVVTPHLSGPTPRQPAMRQIAAAIARIEAGAAPEAIEGYVLRERGY